MKTDGETEWSTELPRFCSYCGHRMVMRPKKDSDYNVHTGHRKHEYYWQCKKLTWWGRAFGTMHDEKLVIEDPDKQIGRYKYRGVLTLFRMGP